MAVSVIATKTVARCKLCKHPQRTEIDALLLKRSQGETDEHGRRFNADYVKELLAAMGVENPTDENIKVHWGKHCDTQTDEQTQAIGERRADVLEAIKSGNTEGLLTADQALDFVIGQGAKELEAKVLAEGKAGVTVDQMMKAIEVKTRRRQDEGVNNLLNELGKGIGAAFVKKLAPGEPAEPDVEIEEGEVTDVG